MEASKRSREFRQSLSPTHKTPKLSQYETAPSLLKILDCRLKKQEDLISQRIKESENRILNEFNKRVDDIVCEMVKIKRDFAEMNKRIVELKQVVPNVLSSNKDLSKRVESLEKSSEGEVQLSNHISALYEKLHLVENMSVACDLRITGIPHTSDENLNQIFWSVCEKIKYDVPKFKAIYRLKSFKDTKDKNDTAIIVRLNSPFERNSFLKSLAAFRRINKTSLRLRHIGFDSNVPFYVNENLTAHNYNVLRSVTKLKRAKKIKNFIVRRGLVFILKHDSDKFDYIGDVSHLDGFLS